MAVGLTCSPVVGNLADGQLCTVHKLERHNARTDNVTACARSLLTPNVAANQINSNWAQKVCLTYELKSNKVG